MGFSRWLRAQGGNTTMIFALAIIPLLAAAGMALDYNRQNDLKAELDSIADAIALEAVDSTSMQTSASSAQAAAEAHFKANAKQRTDVSLEALSVTVADAAGGRVATVKYQASMPSTLMAAIGVTKLTVTGVSTTKSGTPSYLDIFVVADNSPSMGLGATKADVNKLESLTGGCAFACHDLSGAEDTYTTAQANGVTLRIDSVRNATKNLLSAASKVASKNNNFRFGLYTFGASATALGLTPVYPLSSDLDAAQTAASSIKLMDMPYQGYLGDTQTDFASVFAGLNMAIANSGNGWTQSSSKKLVLFVSDGLHDAVNATCAKPIVSAADPVTGTVYSRCQSPIDPAVCKALKDRGITVAIAYTTYLPVVNAWYDTYVAPFNLGPYAPSKNSEIASAMEKCASDGFFQEVGPNDSINDALTDMFNQFLGDSARITG